MTLACREHSQLGGCRPSHKSFSARARNAREMYPVSRVNFGAELGRPPMCLMLNKLHNIVKCFIINLAGLTVQRIFRIRSSLFVSFCCSKKYCVFKCLMVPLPLQRDSPRDASPSVQVRT